jgi:triacylglycerol lipase
MMRSRVKKLTTAALLGTALIAGGAHACDTAPIIFIHGYSGSGGQFDTMIDRFKTDGSPACALYKFGYASLSKSNKTSARELSSFVAAVRPNHANRMAKIVAHSNGGLVSRWYRVFEGGAAATDRLVTLGSPHRGTSWAYGCVSPACFEMRAGSSFLKDLAGRGCDVSLWSDMDEIILPNSSAQCADSWQTASVSHLGLLSNGTVYRDIRRFL